MWEKHIETLLRRFQPPHTLWQRQYATLCRIRASSLQHPASRCSLGGVLLLVPCKATLCGEAALALLADEGTLPGVCAHVCLQLAAQTKGLGADGANEWAFTRVDARMLCQGAAVDEGLVAVGTRVGALARVYAPVHREVALLRKVLATEVTLVRPCPCVHAHVDGATVLLYEAFTALATEKNVGDHCDCAGAA